MKNWYIVITEENHSELLEWWNGKSTNCRPPLVGEYLMSKNPKDKSCYWSRNDTDKHGLNWQQEYEFITLEQFRAITNSNKMKHPEHWYIVATEDNYDELNTWRQTVARDVYSPSFRIGHPLLSEHPGDNSYYYGGSINSLKSDSNYNRYQEITLEQFRQITNSTPIPMPKTIQISRQLLNEYYDAATTPQKEYLTKHFKLDGTTTDEAIRGLYDLACSGWKPKIKANHPECFPEESKYFDFSKYVDQSGTRHIVQANIADSLGMNHGFIRVRSNSSTTKNKTTHNRSFYLDSEYNWELVQDGEEFGNPVMVLIPTKKVK
jgi:hypothetical protein